jgi:hypothetical protein
MEMQGHAREGIEWLESTRNAWATNAGFAIHNAWHLALFYVDLDAGSTALSLYDDVIAPRATSSTAALVDASALLGGPNCAAWIHRWPRSRIAGVARRRGQRAFNLVRRSPSLVRARIGGLIATLLVTTIRVRQHYAGFALALRISEAAGFGRRITRRRLLQCRARHRQSWRQRGSCDSLFDSGRRIAQSRELARLTAGVLRETQQPTQSLAAPLRHRTGLPYLMFTRWAA